MRIPKESKYGVYKACHDVMLPNIHMLEVSRGKRAEWVWSTRPWQPSQTHTQQQQQLTFTQSEATRFKHDRLPLKLTHDEGNNATPMTSPRQKFVWSALLFWWRWREETLTGEFTDTERR